MKAIKYNGQTGLRKTIFNVFDSFMLTYIITLHILLSFRSGCVAQRTSERFLQCEFNSQTYHYFQTKYAQ